MHYDVIIIGSGPSGSSTALHLAQRAPELARRTLVLERDRHPRHKLCGGGCVNDVDNTLRSLDLDPDEIHRVNVSWVNLHFRSRGFRMQLDENLAFNVVRRSEFDAWLAGKVREQGIELMEETRVLKVIRTDEGVEVQTDRGNFRGRVVIGADGATSIVRKLVDPNAPTRLARLVELYTPAEPPRGESDHAADEAYIEFSCVPTGIQGYVWSFPTHGENGPMRNWGVYDSRTVPGKTGGSLKPVVADWLQSQAHSLEDYLLQGHPIRMYHPRGAFAAPHALLVGDAAGTDPMFGEGIGPALGYGNIAARALQDAFDRNDFSFSSYAEMVRHSELGKSLTRRASAAELAYRLRSPLAQKFIWQRLGPVIRWYLQERVFNWTDREQQQRGTAPQSAASRN